MGIIRGTGLVEEDEQLFQLGTAPAFEIWNLNNDTVVGEAFGGLLVIGLFTPVAAFFISCMTLSFLLVLGAGNVDLPYSYNFVFLQLLLH